MSPYTIETDEGRRLLHIIMRGYWDQPTFNAFAHEYEKALMHMHRTGGLELALVDGREFAVQARDISEQFRALIVRHKPWIAKRTATVIPAHLNKLQAERAGSEIAACYFIDMEEARAWLFGGDRPSRASAPV